ncbi:3-methyl-2-oxobutanoate hydroxymethyltransferase [Bordetella ansorpii]|uniref:3-methyl-2-oxobutanoate hydroxymethyltransferase n=1 Tax=Bordetella ansorpii TaxID=288768 RepID=A0A157S7A7_9BORD|nr:3-methyl-2-oxobutanoate hydroxymethyltransferase [Bordetella ansorpii]SAI66279.1 3-methyl-2-oxobutanoate hydroxymethyltransferase [Bordetella ansorpii]
MSTAPHGSEASTSTAETAPYGGPPSAPRRKTTPLKIARMHAEGEKIAMITAYDATFAAVADAAGIDCILVGDSLGMVCQGLTTTVEVSLQEMSYHTRCVAEGVRRAGGTALVIADLPFGSYQQSREQALASAIQLMQSGAEMVKLEGGGWTADTTRFLVERGVPVCAHLGLTPQTVSSLGGFRVQGRTDEEARRLRTDSLALQDAGATMVVFEMVPAALAAALSQELTNCATIGIGAGRGTAGQVLVLHDMLGMNLGRVPKFVRDFMDGAASIQGAMENYVRAVKDGTFPDDARHAW